MRKLSDEEAKALEDSLAQNGNEFENEEAAEKFYFGQRDKDLLEINVLNSKYSELDLNFKAKSLQRFESFYFKSFVDKTLSINISKERMEELMTQYMREVFVSNEMAEWMIIENDFAEGRFELGLLYGYDSYTNENYAYELDKKEDNKNRSYLFDKFMTYVPSEMEDEVL